MPRPTDQMLARLAAEAEEKSKFVDGVIEAAEKDGRDLTSQELELVTRSRDRQKELAEQMEPLEEAHRISNGSRERIAEIARYMGEEGKPAPEFEYRSAGEYALDYWKASVGLTESLERLDLYNRAAAHQTTADNPGLLPTPIVQPVVNFIDASRPLVSFLGPRQIPSNTWVRPKVTQHTNVAVQPTGEKNELVSQKMTIAKLTGTASTYGGYVNVSRQDIDWSTPSIMDVVINDMAAKYAQVTEQVAAAAAIAAAPTSTTIPTGAATTAALTTALWKAAGEVFTATAGSGRVAFFVASDMLGLWAPLFAPVNPQNAQSPGFEAANFGTGLMGQISGIPVYMSAGLAAGQMVMVSSSAFEAYEDRIGSLQVIEPSVLGVQVAYAGYFTTLVIETTGLQEIIKTP
jgi:HK97 family phage major capsid protein